MEPIKRRLVAIGVGLVFSVLLIFFSVQQFELSYGGIDIKIPSQSIKGIKSNYSSTLSSNVQVQTTTSEIERKSINNKTLGFQSIEALVMPHREDQLDILALLSWAYKLAINIFPGVYPEDMKVIPEEDDFVKATFWTNKPSGETACWRAHARVWRKMLANNIETTLILEGDADWGLSFREEMIEISKAIPQLQAQLNEHVSNNDYDDNDPYQSQTWDVLQFGWCAESAKTVSKGRVVYTGPETVSWENMHPNFFVYQVYNDAGVRMQELMEQQQRILQVSLGAQCTVAYAVSSRGAAKLLHKTTRHYAGPIDAAMARFSQDLDLVAFSVVPPIFYQRKYTEGHGIDSDIGDSRGKKREISLGTLDLNSTLDQSLGFDGDSDSWKPAEFMIDRSATMAMSALIWPEKTSAGPRPEQNWIDRGKQDVLEMRRIEAEEELKRKEDDNDN